MYIKVKTEARSFLGNLDTYGGINTDNGRVSFNIPTVSRILNGGSSADIDARFDDICDALDSGKVVVYDANKPVGYWKPKTTHKKAASKAPAKAPTKAPEGKE